MINIIRCTTRTKEMVSCAFQMDHQTRATFKARNTNNLYIWYSYRKCTHIHTYSFSKPLINPVTEMQYTEHTKDLLVVREDDIFIS